MIKWKGIGVGAALALCMATVVSAQERPVTSRGDRGDTLKMNVSGRVNMDYVSRSDQITFLSNSVNPSTGSDGENTVEGEIAIRLDAELSDKVSVVVEIGKTRVDGGIDRFTGAASETIVLREAAIVINEFLTPALKAKLGISDWTFDVRGKGRSFAFDPRHSQTIVRNYARTEDTLASWATRTNDPDENYPVGVVLTYTKDAMTFDLVVLPVMAEGGNPSEDEALYALDFWYNLDSMGKGSRLGLILSGMTFGPGAAPGTPTLDDKSNVFTLGGGVVLNGLAAGLEVYGEGYIQFGGAGQFIDAGSEEEAKARGKAGQFGFEYRVESERAIWFGANVTYVSGDGDNQADDENVDAFLSYENVRDLMILEDQYFGFDVDVNYTAFKISGGASFNVGQGKNNLEVMAIVGICRANEDIQNGAENEEDLGNEFDLVVKYHLNKQVMLKFGFAYITGSDIMEEAMGGSASDDSDDKGFLWSLGFDAAF